MHKRFEEAQKKAKEFMPRLQANMRMRRKNGLPIINKLGCRIAYVTLINSKNLTEFRKRFRYDKKQSLKGYDSIYNHSVEHMTKILNFID